jgi:hypothetical protein
MSLALRMSRRTKKSERREVWLAPLAQGRAELFSANEPSISLPTAENKWSAAAESRSESSPCPRPLAGLRAGLSPVA